jgi:N-acetylmuramoyl-L-alanine amidase
MTSILKYAVLALSLSLTATLQAETNHKQSQTQTLSKDQLECLATNTYMEARGEGEKGMLATIFVVLNRTKDSRFPSTPCKVIAQPNQFEWWGKGKTIKEPKEYDKAKQLVHEVLGGKHKDVTCGAIYFNAHHKAPKNTKLTVRIGNHSFFK